MQIILARDPAPKSDAFCWASHAWDCHWIEDPAWDGATSHACAFRRVFSLGADAKVRFHISADSRYTLFLDGARLGAGPERGDDSNWFYQTHELTLPAGVHRLVAVVWWTSERLGLRHLGHLSHAPALMVRGEGPMEETLSTGRADWQALPLEGVTFRMPVSGADCLVGGRTHIDAARMPRGYEAGADDAGLWQPARKGPAAFLRAHILTAFTNSRQLRHGTLPPMFEKIVTGGKVRHAQPVAALETADALPFNPGEADEAAIHDFQRMLDGHGAATVPPGTTLRVLIDVGNYVCAWPILKVAGGAGAVVHIDWAESLYDDARRSGKGDRGAIDGKFFTGIGDSLACDGGDFVFEPFWWEAGRYIRLLVKTTEAPLAIASLELRETHYPHRFESRFACADRRWNNVFKISKRVLEMCSHETYVDCPYYEQLMYVGDTRLEALVTYATTRDDRLPRKAVHLFDESRDATGLTRSRTPCIEPQVIPPFSLWWIFMVHDHAFWRDDLAFIRDRMPGVRAVIEAFRRNIHDDDGLLHGLDGWNFTDWVPDWRPGGIPPDGHRGANATINLQFAWALRTAAELEDLFGERELAARDRRLAHDIAAAAKRHFWVASRGLFAESKSRDRFSEHAQCMAVLGGSVPKGADIAQALLGADDLDRTTIYFSHYLFETFRVLGRTDAIYDRLGLWFEHAGRGLKTTIESPEPTRSDCHAWGAHPMFHAFATFAGIRPAAPGFRKVVIAPQPGPLDELNAKLVHPAGGFVALQATRGRRGALHGVASVPDGIEATLVLPAGTRQWTGGAIKF